MANTWCSGYINSSLAFLSVWIVFNDENLIANPVFGVSAISRFSLILSISFLIYDMLILSLPLIRHHFFPEYTFEDMIKADESVAYLKEENAAPEIRFIPIKVLLCKEWDNFSPDERYAFLGHHLTALLSFGCILSSNQLLYFANHRLMAELSTPFLNILKLCDNVSSVPPVVVDFLKISFSIVFIGCRLCTMPSFWGEVWNTNFVEGVTPWTRAFNLLAPALLDALNIFWAHKIVYKIVRVLRRVESSIKYE